MMSTIKLTKAAAAIAISGAMGLTAAGLGVGIANADDGGPWVPWVPWHPGENIDNWVPWQPGDWVPGPWHWGGWQNAQGDQQ
jgi:hypothetical protein